MDENNQINQPEQSQPTGQQLPPTPAPAKGSNKALVVVLVIVGVFIVLGIVGSFFVKRMVANWFAGKGVETFVDKISDGAMNVDMKEGTMTFTDDEGTTSETSFNMGEKGGAKLPSDYPAYIPKPPANVNLLTAARNKDRESLTFSASYSYKGDPNEVFDYYVKKFSEDSNYELVGENQMGTFLMSVTATYLPSGEDEQVVSVSIMADEEGEVMFTVGTMEWLGE